MKLKELRKGKSSDKKVFHLRVLPISLFVIVQGSRKWISRYEERAYKLVSTGVSFNFVLKGYVDF